MTISLCNIEIGKSHTVVDTDCDRYMDVEYYQAFSQIQLKRVCFDRHRKLFGSRLVGTVTSQYSSHFLEDWLSWDSGSRSSKYVQVHFFNEPKSYEWVSDTDELGITMTFVVATSSVLTVFIFAWISDTRKFHVSNSCLWCSVILNVKSLSRKLLWEYFRSQELTSARTSCPRSSLSWFFLYTICIFVLEINDVFCPHVMSQYSNCNFRSRIVAYRMSLIMFMKRTKTE